MDGFSSLRVQFTSTTGEASSTHYIYCKLHRVRENSEITPNDKTLFTLGWPPYCTKLAITELFSRAGQVVDTYLQASPGGVDVRGPSHTSTKLHPSGFQVGYIVMSSESEARAALQLCDVDTALQCKLTSVGLKRWTTHYAKERPSVSALEGMAVGVISSYDLCQNEKLKKRRFGEPDEEGWITVTRKRKFNQSHQDDRKKKRKKELVNLYPWQQRETQRAQIAELRQKFEEDKRRVAEMKSRRKFKPF